MLIVDGGWSEGLRLYRGWNLCNARGEGRRDSFSPFEDRITSDFAKQIVHFIGLYELMIGRVPLLGRINTLIRCAIGLSRSFTIAGVRFENVRLCLASRRMKRG